MGVAVSLQVMLAASSAAAGLGNDLTNLNLCLYGDCEARGSYAADPWGWPNPAAIPVGTLPYVQRGATVSVGYFALDAGQVEVDVGSLTVTSALSPYVVQVNAIYADAAGEPASTPGLDLSLETEVVRLAAAVDLERAGWVEGLALGILVGVPGTDSDLKLRSAGVPVVRSNEEHGVAVTVGLHYRAGERDWFAAGAFVQGIEHDAETDQVDPTTGGTTTDRGTTNAWFARAGVSILPFVPWKVLDAQSVAGEMANDFRLGMDLEYRNISAPGEGTRSTEVFFAGLDARLLPDRWNPLARYLRPYGIGGADTDGGWGAGLGIYGNPEGPLAWFSLNIAHSDRDLASSLGSSVKQWVAGMSFTIPW